MALLDELRNSSDEKFKEMLDEFVTNLIPRIKESAGKGYSGYQIKLNVPNDNRFILFNNSNFLCALQKDERLEGLKISIEQKVVNSILGTSWTESYLSINWATK
ncbi:hypothetical protein ACS78_08100 [Priestia megaterium]|uniref:hypothetical protein n=1 Tax=Priestia megaterium TaxID=1404 RepID=UPI0006835BCC|nr:hypothetical protein [Priestia megaterium]KNH23905.1 hypothetical protein ACS78_08100 [Priestia megaterium]